MITAVWAAVLIVLASAAAWHAVTGHHAHLRLLHLARPATIVPPARHDVWWHRLPGWRRVQVDAALVICAALAGLAWSLAPGVVAVTLILAVLSGSLALTLHKLRAGREES